MVRLLGQLHHPLIYVLLVAATVTAALGEAVDASVVFGVVVVNALVPTSQSQGNLGCP